VVAALFVANAAQAHHVMPAVKWRSPVEHEISRHIAKVNPRQADEIAHAVYQAGIRHRVDPALILAVIEQESRFKPSATGPGGERGLMQIKRSTARVLGLEWKRAYDIRLNVEAGTRYLATHLAQYQTTRRAVSRYNGGSREYAADVMRRYKLISVKLQ
jgi:soluble lytic murein transglycosylase-like protein